ALAIAEADPDAAYAPTLLAVVAAHLHLVGDGLHEARAALATAAATVLDGPSRGTVLVLGAQSLVEMDCGELVDAERLAGRASALADDPGFEATHATRRYAELTRAALAMERGELGDADDGLERTMRIVEGRRPALEVETHLHLARLAAIRG